MNSWRKPRTTPTPKTAKRKEAEESSHELRVNYSQLWQNYLNNYFQAKVGKELPKQFPEAISVGKLDVGNFVFPNTANTLQAGNYLKYFQGGSKSVIHYLTNC